MAGRSDPRQLQALREARKRNLLGPTQNAALQEIERRFMSFVEPAATMASAMVAEPVSGFVGLAATPFGSDVATRAINKTQEAMTYQPRTEAGMQGLQSLSNFMAPVGQAFEGASSFLGDAAFDATGSPALGAAAYSIPTMGLEALGLKAARAIPGRQFEMGDIGPGAMGGRQRGIFAGVNAKNADMDALTRAQAMASQGANRDEVWSQTGWFKDVDGGWKFEIDDSGYSFPKKGMEDLQSFGARNQGNIVKHDELFKNYPDARDITITNLGERNSMGAYVSADDSIELNPAMLRDATSRKKIAPSARGEVSTTNLHENQHAIQGREGFAEGGSQSGIFNQLMNNRRMDENYLSDLNNALSNRSRQLDEKRLMTPNDTDGIKSLEDSYQKLLNERQAMVPDMQKDIGEESFRQYERLAGEAEARNVETRMNMTPEERMARPPWQTLDVPESDLIVKRGSGGAMESGAVSTPAAFKGMTKDEFLGKPTITSDKNAADLKPRDLNDSAPKSPFLDDNLEATFGDSGAAVYDGDKVIASYNFGGNLVVNKKYRRKGIAEELVYQWRTRYPGKAKARDRTKKAQAVQEKVWDRIQRENMN